MVYKAYYQDISRPDGKAGDVYSFGSWICSASAPRRNAPTLNSSEQRQNGIVLQFYKSGKLLSQQYVLANDDCEDWQFISGGASADSFGANLEFLYLKYIPL